MSPRASRVVFGLLVIAVGTLALAGALFVGPRVEDLLWLGVLCEVAVLVVGGSIAVTAPPPAPLLASTRAPAPAPALGSIYRGARPPAQLDPITKGSAKRLTLGLLAALAFTGAAVPFALHLPRWIEGELVVAAWWAIWSIVIGVVAYRGARVDDDHRPTTAARVAELGGPGIDAKWSWLLEGLGDPEGCLVVLAMILVVGVALLGAWLVVELVAPAVFVVAYRCVVRAFAKAHAAKTRGDAPRSALVGMGWAAAYTLPLAGLVALVHAIASLKAS